MLGSVFCNSHCAFFDLFCIFFLIIQLDNFAMSGMRQPTTAKSSSPMHTSSTAMSIWAAVPGWWSHLSQTGATWHWQVPCTCTLEDHLLALQEQEKLKLSRIWPRYVLVVYVMLYVCISMSICSLWYFFLSQTFSWHDVLMLLFHFITGSWKTVCSVQLFRGTGL